MTHSALNQCERPQDNMGGRLRRANLAKEERMDGNRTIGIALGKRNVKCLGTANHMPGSSSLSGRRSETPSHIDCPLFIGDRRKSIQHSLRIAPPRKPLLFLTR